MYGFGDACGMLPVYVTNFSKILDESDIFFNEQIDHPSSHDSWSSPSSQEV